MKNMKKKYKASEIEKITVQLSDGSEVDYKDFFLSLPKEIQEKMWQRAKKLSADFLNKNPNLVTGEPPK